MKTILELAKELNVTKNTIKYHMKYIPSNTIQKTDKGIIYITDEGIKAIIDRIGKKNHQEPVETEQNHTKEPLEPRKEKTTATQTTEQNQEKPPRETIKELHKIIDKLQDENNKLKEEINILKDKIINLQSEQINKKDNQIDGLIKTVDRAQALHGGTIQKELIESNTIEEPPTEQKTKKKIFQKLFRK